MRSARYRPARVNWIWLVSAGATAAAVALTAFLLAPPPPCAASAGGAGPVRPVAGRGNYRTPAVAAPALPGMPGSVYSARALYYDPGTALGSCTLGPFRAGGWYAGLSPRQFAHGHTCGTYLEVHGPSGTVRAEVVDLCPTCLATTINLSRSAYDRIGDPRPGVAPVTYRWVANPRLRHPLSLHVSAPAPGELAIQVVSHGNRLMAVAITPAGPATPAWHRLHLDTHDFWIAHGLSGTGPYAVRITDVLGHQVTLPRVMLIPGTVTRTSTWLYQRRHAAPAPAPARPALARRPTAGCGR